METVELIKDGVVRIADVLTGGDSTVPVPAALDSVAAKVAAVLGSDEMPKLPYVDLSDHSMALAIVATVLPPLLWNLIGPLEYYTRIVSKLTLRPIIGVYLSGGLIASLSVYRSALFVAAINSQPRCEQMDVPLLRVTGGFFFAFGLAMFLGAYYQLGITGTYLGDYFGFFRNEMITAFPFSILHNPMYDGSSMFHFAEALLDRSPAGVILAGWLFFCYRFGCIFEEPFTARMYAKRDSLRKRQKTK